MDTKDSAKPNPFLGLAETELAKRLHNEEMKYRFVSGLGAIVTGICVYVLLTVSLTWNGVFVLVIASYVHQIFQLRTLSEIDTTRKLLTSALVKAGQK